MAATKTKEKQTPLEKGLLKLIQPMLDAQEEVQCMQEDDLHIAVTLRVTRGDAAQGEALAYIDTTVTLPGVLSQSQANKAVGAVENQLRLLVIEPSTARIQDYVTKCKLITADSEFVEDEIGSASFGDATEADMIQGVIDEDPV